MLDLVQLFNSFLLLSFTEINLNLSSLMLTAVALYHGEPESCTTKTANLSQMCIYTKTTTQRGLFKIKITPNTRQDKRTVKKEVLF